MKEQDNTPQAYSKNTGKDGLISGRMVYEGPLPPAGEMAKYESICNGAADRIIAMAEKEQQIKESVVKSEMSCMRLGLYFGFFLLVGIISLTAWAIYLDKQWVAAILIAFITVSGYFISRRQINDK